MRWLALYLQSLFELQYWAALEEASCILAAIHRVSFTVGMLWYVHVSFSHVVLVTTTAVGLSANAKAIEHCLVASGLTSSFAAIKSATISCAVSGSKSC